MGYVGQAPGKVLLSSADITDGIIANADIASDAAIVLSKTALSAGTGLTLSTNTLNVDASQTGVTSVGALNVGSITSGFTSIDVGSGGLTTTGAIAGGTIDATTDFTIGSTVITDDVITFTPTSSDTVTMTADTNGAFSIVTVDAAAAAANIIITADGTVDVNSAGLLTLDSGAAINIEPASGSAILLDGTISIDAGVVTGATSITSTAFVGDITGDVTGNASGTAATVTSGTQASITTLANVVEVGALDAGSITSGFGAIDNGTAGIRTDTFTAETSIVPDASGGADIGTTSLEWGDVFIADDKAVKFGSGQDASIEYDENGTDQLRIAGNTIFENQVQYDKDILLDSTPADTVYSGITAQFTAGEDLEDGECVYLKAADTKMWKAVSNTGGTGLISAEIMCVAMCVADVSADATGTFLLQGFIRADTNFPTYAVGETLYVPEAEVSGKNVPEGASPDTDGDFVQVIGWAADANTVFFNPDFTVIEHA